MVEKSPDAFRTISEAAEELDVPQHVLRFWETRFTADKADEAGGRPPLLPAGRRRAAARAFAAFSTRKATRSAASRRSSRKMAPPMWQVSAVAKSSRASAKARWLPLRLRAWPRRRRGPARLRPRRHRRCRSRRPSRRGRTREDRQPPVGQPRRHAARGASRPGRRPQDPRPDAAEIAIRNKV